MPASLPFFASPHVPVLTSEEMRAWDAASIRRSGVPERVLMETAARAAASAVQRLHPRGRVAVAVGSGNNGGDARVLARTLAAWGRDVVEVQVGTRTPDDALLHGWTVPAVPADQADDAFRGAAVIVDGLLGTGATGAPREVYAAAIRAIHASGRPVVALDGPSGVDLTTGAVPGEAVRAEVTVTFGAPKRGLLLFPGREHTGRIIAVEVGFAPREGDAARLITPAWARQLLAPVPPNAHKGSMGRVVVVAGRAGMAGACVLAGTGALRAGAGMAVMVTPDANRVIVQSSLPEALYVDRDGADTAEVQKGAAAVVAGPAMGTDDEAFAFLSALGAGGAAPLLLDADALTLLSRDASLRGRMDRPLLLTPHPGEAARLLRTSVDEITRDPFAAVEALAERFRCAVLLKGNPSLVAETGRETRVNVAGHSGLATGGNGDVLSGVIGALLGQGMAPADAAAAGLYFSGRAAEIAGRGRGLIPTDVANALPDALLEQGREEAEPLIPGTLLDLPAPR